MNEKIIDFLSEHHVLSLNTCVENQSWSSSCFYAFLQSTDTFVFASDTDTRHMQNIAKNPQVSGVIALETKQIGLIRGLQFEGVVQKASKSGEKAYFKAYPFARIMLPKLWEIEITYAKLTDNRLGFGKKLEYKRA
ncbi:MAG: pyridoxamine 5'-phosphate oxidase family protein [Campylobacteraceae bacterium]|jgi:uncharacterized protein YhbP (UPF0306 family)|nr:pyridoxamine 5'-phosphate oxidase family protein [Campylobacteraceae bacterium]